MEKLLNLVSRLRFRLLVPSKTVLFGVGFVIGLLAGFAVGFVYLQGQISSLQGNLSQANGSISMLHEDMANGTTALSLVPQQGQMIHTAWVFIAPVGSGDYAVFLHAEGLEPATSGSYIVEGVSRTGSMNMVPIGANATASEFGAGAGGAGNYWTVLMENPSSSYETIELLYLPGMNMTQATLIASASLG